jgi:hypothetical protein
MFFKNKDETMQAPRMMGGSKRKKTIKSYSLAFFSSVGEPFAVIGGEIVPRLERR